MFNVCNRFYPIPRIAPARDRAAAARAHLAGARQPEHHLRARARRHVADRAQHALRVPGRVEHACAW